MRTPLAACVLHFGAARARPRGALRVHRLGALAVLLLAAAARAEAPVDFRSEVWPLIARNCVACHSVNQRYANLQLDSPARILQGGDTGPVVVPGAPEKSELIRRVSLPANSPDRMPRERKPLTPAEIARLQRWIAEGASFGGWVGMGAVAHGAPR